MGRRENEIPKPTISVKRKWRKKNGQRFQDEKYTAIIRYGKQLEFQRGTGCSSRASALDAAQEIADEITTNELPKRTAINITVDALFGRWWTEYASKQRSHKNMYQVAGVVQRLIDPETHVRDIDDEFVEDFVALLEDGHHGKRAPATINRHLNILRGALRYGRKKWKDRRDQFNEIEWSDFIQREPKERVIFLSQDEMKRLFSLLPVDIALAAAWSVYSACRLNETRTLQRSNIHREAEFCEVHAKGGGMRSVPLSEIAIKILNAAEDFYQKSGRVDDVLFDLTNRRKMWDIAREKFGKPELRWHDLRHVAATWLRQSGQELKAIGRVLGHSHISTTTRYAHVGDSELVNAMNGMPDVTKQLHSQAESAISNGGYKRGVRKNVRLIVHDEITLNDKVLIGESTEIITPGQRS